MPHRKLSPPGQATARDACALLWLLPFLFWLGCSGNAGSPNGEDAGCVEPPPEEGSDAGVPADVLVPSRLLRRSALALRGEPPTDEEYAALEAAGNEAAQRAYVSAFVDRTLQEPTFYRTLFETARDWFNIPPVGPSADPPEYGLLQQRSIVRCPEGTPKAGAWKYFRDDKDACLGLKPDGTPAEERSLESWWAPGATTVLVGFAASVSPTGQTYDASGFPVTVNCTTAGPVANCGCGPAAARCHADTGSYPGWEDYGLHSPQGQRRLVAEEPARLFAHLGWHDRPMTDLILGNYSVGPTRLQAAYVMQGLAGELTHLLEDDSWWRPSRFASAPVDPDHRQGDPTAWREYSVPARNPFFLEERDYRYDPRTQSTAMKGIPAAGMLTSLGFLSAYPRERVRGARALEMLACEELSPPQGQEFNEYKRDPGTEGTCQHCHRRVDPAAIHFKRFAKMGHGFEGHGATYPMPGVGKVWHWPARWRTGEYPYHSDPFSHWNRWYMPDTLLTPVTQAQADANPEAVFIDFLPAEQNLLGQASDGTVGPLGFAKLIVASGSFDRCVVRHLHAQVMGRDIDPTKEAGYLEDQVARFISGGRKARPYIKALTQSDLFQRGR